MLIAGIDLAWQSQNNPTALAIGMLSGNELTLQQLNHDLMSIEAIASQLAAHPLLRGVAIDGPLTVNNQSGQRPCERLTSKAYGGRKASCHTSNLHRYPAPDGVRLSQILKASGFAHLAAISEKWQIECYPHPALIEIFGLKERHLYKKGTVSSRIDGQVALAKLMRSLSDSSVLRLRVPTAMALPFDTSHIRSLVGMGLKRNEDVLDAVICVYVAGLYALGVNSKVFGSVEDGYIYVPQQRCI